MQKFNTTESAKALQRNVLARFNGYCRQDRLVRVVRRVRLSYSLGNALPERRFMSLPKEDLLITSARLYDRSITIARETCTEKRPDGRPCFECVCAARILAAQQLNIDLSAYLALSQRQ